jgi:hypothetical protein
MRQGDRFAPRAMLVRSEITIRVSASELHRLIRSLEAEAMAELGEGRDDYADFLLRRVAELRMTALASGSGYSSTRTIAVAIGGAA